MTEPKVAILIVTAALLVPASRGGLAAQLVSKIDAGQYSVSDGVLPMSTFRVSPAVQWLTPYAHVTARGSAYLTDQQVQLADGIVSGTFTSPTVYGVRAEMIGNASRAVDDRSLGTDQVDVQTRVHVLFHQHGGVWFGGGVARPWRIAVISSAEVADAGAWGKIGETTARFGSATMTATFTNFSFSKIASLGDSGSATTSAASACDVAAPSGVASSTPLRALFSESAASVDACSRQSRFADLEGSVHWEAGPLELTAQTGHRFGNAYDVTPDSRQWSSASATVWLTDRVAIIGGGGRQPALPLRGLPARSYGMAGLEIAYSPMSKSAVPVSLPHAVLVHSFEIHTAPSGLQKIVIHVGGVETVDVMGDFSDWSPLTLVRRGRDLWELSVPVSPGVHQINVRVDGGPWMAPPGIPTVRDAFDGEVGMIVVQAPKSDR
ncbi:MAG TPA: glycogen-binding domain-containing protein [Gemmatimonadaceae bacterium]|nr:glycogen-binding domain-containing protein [Gemmatimonadaceae bacterium]